MILIDICADLLDFAFSHFYRFFELLADLIHLAIAELEEGLEALRISSAEQNSHYRFFLSRFYVFEFTHFVIDILYWLLCGCRLLNNTTVLIEVGSQCGVWHYWRLCWQWFVDWLVDWLPRRWLVGWLVDWLPHRWLVDWLVDWLPYRWLADWLVDWLLHLARLYHRLCVRYGVVLSF